MSTTPTTGRTSCCAGNGRYAVQLRADVAGRRMSVIVGWFLVGLRLLIEGDAPLFATALFAQVVSGLGITFTGGGVKVACATEGGTPLATSGPGGLQSTIDGSRTIIGSTPFDCRSVGAGERGMGG